MRTSAAARTVQRFDRQAEPGAVGESRIVKLTAGTKADEARAAKLHTLGDGKLSFRMVVRIKHWQARARRRPVPKGKVFVEKLVHLATWNAPDYGPQTGPKVAVDPIQQRLAELQSADYANQVIETRKRVRQIREDREFLETCYDLLDSNADGKLAAEELEHWAALLLADHASVADTPNCVLKYWIDRSECGTLTHAERLDLQLRLDKKHCPRDRLEYDWQDFLLVTLDFYTLAGTLAMHQTFCRLLDPVDDGERPLSQPSKKPPPIALPRPPIKLPRRRCDVIQAGSWEQRVGARERSQTTQRQPRRPLQPVPVDVLGPPRPRQPLRPTRPILAIAPGTPKCALPALRTPTASSYEHGQSKQSAVATGVPATATPGPNLALRDTAARSIVWSCYDVDSHGHVLGHVGPRIQKIVDKRINRGIMPSSLRQLTVETARSARRVTQDLRPSSASDPKAKFSSDDGADKYGWRNNLPVVIIPGMCSSGLEVKKSEVSPTWQGQRVWFSLEKLGRQRSATTRAAAKTVDLATDVATAPARLVGQVISKRVGKRAGALVGNRFMRFHLHRARNLIAGDVDGQSDPVARVELLNSEGEAVESTESRIKHNTRNPFWDETYELGLHVRLDDIHAVRITILDDDGILSGRDNLGETTIKLQPTWQHNLSSVGDRALPRAWHKLQDTRDLQRYSIFESLTHMSRMVDKKSAAATFGGEVECWADVLDLRHSWNYSESDSSELDRESDSSEDPATPLAVLRNKASSGRALVSEAAQSVVEKGARAAFAAVDGAVSVPSRGLTRVDTRDLKDFDTKLWLRHMLLAPDAHSDPSGIEVRAVPGLSGVDYLQPGTVMKTTTWVFGPVIKFLMAGGYDESNLKGAPYDWRMPPMCLEERDGYFSGLCKTIEETYHDNGQKPVVLLAHSMGNNMAHYFTNWVLNNDDKIQQIKGPANSNGEAWLDKYVHSLFGIGGPYLGASEALRSCITGDDFGMGPALLPAEDARTLCQAMGSGAWLLPAGRLVEHHPVAYDSVQHKTETSVKLGNGVASGHYEIRNVDEALRRHGAEHVAEQKKQWYDRDPCIPGGTSMMPPPVKRVFHVYGINLDTQVSCVFKQQNGCHELDTSVDFGRIDGMKYQKGIILETDDTSQRALHADTFVADRGGLPEPTEIRRVSGDGTVPYSSLQHTLSWNSPRCLSQVVELDRAEHREILGDSRFHQVLGDYLCDTLVVYVVAARNLAAKDLLTQSSDPFCVVTLHTSPKDPQRRTKTHKNTLNPEFNEVFTFGLGQSGDASGDVLESARVISIEVRDSDLHGLKSDHIGRMALPFQTIVNSPNHAINGWFKLMPDDHVDDPDLVSQASQLCNGEIFVQFELESAGQSFRGVPDHLNIVHENMRSYRTDPDGAHQHHHHHHHQHGASAE